MSTIPKHNSNASCQKNFIANTQNLSVNQWNPVALKLPPRRCEDGSILEVEKMDLPRNFELTIFFCWEHVLKEANGLEGTRSGHNLTQLNSFV